MVGPEPTALPLGESPTVVMIIPHVYSLRNASTGSFFDAALAGIMPPISVKITDNTIRNRAILGSRAAESGISPVKW